MKFGLLIATVTNAIIRFLLICALHISSTEIFQHCLSSIAVATNNSVVTTLNTVNNIITTTNAIITATSTTTATIIATFITANVIAVIIITSGAIIDEFPAPYAT
jgi:hypothetical protein